MEEHACLMPTLKMESRRGRLSNNKLHAPIRTPAPRPPAGLGSGPPPFGQRRRKDCVAVGGGGCVGVCVVRGCPVRRKEEQRAELKPIFLLFCVSKAGRLAASAHESAAKIYATSLPDVPLQRLDLFS